jgi:methionyl-tRNA formyltransferase
MRAVFLGRKSLALSALDCLTQRGWDVMPVVSKRPEPDWAVRPTFHEGVEARDHRLVTQADVNGLLASDERGSPASDFLSQPVDLVVSFLFPERVRAPLLMLPKLGAINFHPAPLPEYGGMAGYNLAVLEGQTSYGVTAHIMTEQFDSGPILRIRRFPIAAHVRTAFDLEAQTRSELLALFFDLVEEIESLGELPHAEPQISTRYVSAGDLDDLKRLDLGRESAETLSRKVRAFWYPPFDGAYIEVDGRRYTLLDEEILAELGHLWHTDRK